MYYVIKVLISAILIVAISELSKRSSLIGAILASIPFVSVLAFIWIYVGYIYIKVLKATHVLKIT